MGKQLLSSSDLSHFFLSEKYISEDKIYTAQNTNLRLFLNKCFTFGVSYENSPFNESLDCFEGKEHYLELETFNKLSKDKNAYAYFEEFLKDTFYEKIDDILFNIAETKYLYSQNNSKEKLDNEEKLFESETSKAVYGYQEFQSEYSNFKKEFKDFMSQDEHISSEIFNLLELKNKNLKQMMYLVDEILAKTEQLEPIKKQDSKSYYSSYKLYQDLKRTIKRYRYKLDWFESILLKLRNEYGSSLPNVLYELNVLDADIIKAMEEFEFLLEGFNEEQNDLKGKIEKYSLSNYTEESFSKSDLIPTKIDRLPLNIDAFSIGDSKENFQIPNKNNRIENEYAENEHFSKNQFLINRVEYHRENIEMLKETFKPIFYE